MKKFNLKKTTTAAIAATVGAVLLLGGAGTLAYWSDNAESSAQVISSGTLDVSPTTGNVWNYMNGTTVTANVVDQIVPGDKVQTTIQVPVKLVGKNLKATLEVTRTTVAAATLSGAVVTTKVGTTAESTAAAVVSQTLTTSPTAPTTVPVVVTVEFPNTIAGKTDMTNPDATVSAKSLQFSLAYVLTQIA